MKKIGVMDWGIGGLSVYKALRAQDPNSAIVYFSDSGFTPYGKTEREVLRHRLEKIGAFFILQGVQDVYVACNAASCALNEDIETLAGVRFTSIIPAGLRAARSTHAKRMGVIGGQLTIASGIYQKRLTSQSTHFNFAPAQPLSAFVECGKLDGPDVERAIQNVINELGPIDSLLLACTHYPALAPTFHKLYPELELLDPAKFILVGSKTCEQEPSLTFLTTGDEETTRLAALRAYGVALSGVTSLVIN